MTEFWKRFCEIQRYAFFRGDDCVNKVPFSTGNHIEVGAAEELVDEMDQEISTLRQQLEQAEQNCRERIKAERLHWLKNGDEFAQQMAERLEQAEARVAEFARFVRAGDRLCYELESWLAAEHDKDSQRAINLWKDLRQQADEIEKGGTHD